MEERHNKSHSKRWKTKVCERRCCQPSAEGRL